MKYLFPSTDVAIYATVSVITKFALIVIGAIEMVYLPIFINMNKKSEHKKNLILLVCISLLGFLISWSILPIVGETVIRYIKPELIFDSRLFTYLGIAATSL
jgi:O-antigen/teichoic acid export membrane protein